MTIRVMDMLADGGEGVGATQKNTISFENVRVPASYLVGSENNGWQVASTHLELEHGGSGSISSETWFHKSLEFAKKFQNDGEPPLKDADARDQLADILVNAEITRLFQLPNYWANRTHQPRPTRARRVHTAQAGTAYIQKVIIARRLGVGRDEAEVAAKTPE